MDSITRIKQFIDTNLTHWEKVDFAVFNEEIDFRQDYSNLYKIDNDEIVLISYTNISITGSDRPKPQLRVFLDEYKKPFYFAKKHQLRYYLFSIFTKDDTMAKGLNNFNPKEYIISIETNLDNEDSRRDLRSIYDYANINLKGKKFLKCSRNNYKADINQASFIYIGTPEHPEIETFENFINIFDSRPYQNSIKQPIINKNSVDSLRQIIFYGAPGTGKSYKIKKMLKSNNVMEENIFRTTFHPDSDYSTFVGAYKPTMQNEDKYLERLCDIDYLASLFKNDYYKADKKTVAVDTFAIKYAEYLDGKYSKVSLRELCEKAEIPTGYEVAIRDTVNAYHACIKPQLKPNQITYRFVAQAFTKAYIRAYQCPTEDVYLIIEEINRGNCAQIFGDLFQLLDRNADGTSDYTIKADDDLRDFLEEEFGRLGVDDAGIANGELCLPSNLYIWATMNTSDQSLFPIDSAFKRRWDWEYEPIKYNHDMTITIGNKTYQWTSFQRIVNAKIKDGNGGEDKMLGDYFVNPSNGIINEDMLRNKILFYLWNDVCKDGEDGIFKVSENEEITFSELFGEEGKSKLVQMMEYLGVEEDDGQLTES